jgi:Raf kinase inhibitor-like YbhB/YbcL family protein
MKITSTAFGENERIPSVYTCDGANTSPELRIDDVPSDAKSLVLLMDDPDVPKNLRPDGNFDHWVMYDIAPDTKVIPEGRFAGIEGNNGTGKIGYIGPCPPDREHRYFFKLYALDTKLDLPSGKSKKEIQDAILGHVLTSAELIGRYERKK